MGCTGRSAVGGSQGGEGARLGDATRGAAELATAWAEFRASGLGRGAAGCEPCSLSPSMHHEQSHLSGLFVVPSSQDTALPERRIARRSPRWGLGGLSEVAEESGDILGLGDEGEEAHATTAAGHVSTSMPNVRLRRSAHGR